jgi:energy-coupling factor transporter ATP-binding protein EcfA2
VLRYCREHFSAAIDFSSRSALIEADTQTGIVDIVRFVISTVLINNKGFLMHAASIMRRGQIYVFAGPSASGKTTLCQTMPGASVLTDETSALVRNGCGFRAHSTCFAGEYGQVRCNVSAPVKSIFFIRKGSRFRHRRLDSCASCTEMLRNCILDFHETTLMRRLLATVDALAGRVPCYELSVSRGGELWRYIDGFVDEVCAQ